MPYRVRKQNCKRSDGKKGNYVLKYKPKSKTSKKKDSEGYVKAGCHTSKKKARAQRSAIEGPKENNITFSEIEDILMERILRIIVKHMLVHEFKILK